MNTVSIYQKEKDGLGIVYNGSFHEWEFYGQTEKELIESIKKTANEKKVGKQC